MYISGHTLRYSGLCVVIKSDQGHFRDSVHRYTHYLWWLVCGYTCTADQGHSWSVGSVVQLL